MHLAGSGAGFFFGLATAPAHVEDQLDDAWLEFAEESKPEKEVVEYGTSDKTEEYGPGGSNVEGEGEKRSKSLSSSDGAQATLAEESGKKLNGETAGKTAGRMPLDLQACIFVCINCIDDGWRLLFVHLHAQCIHKRLERHWRLGLERPSWSKSSGSVWVAKISTDSACTLFQMTMMKTSQLAKASRA